VNPRTPVILAAATLLLSGCIPAPALYKPDGQISMLVTPAGMTLYTFDTDKKDSGLSACYDNCAKNWPPLQVGDSQWDSMVWAIILRTDGLRQWTYRGKPLYTFAKDTRPGEANGEGVNKVWRIARP
jgi:predicted lipoprotein with Yx(FWY)xxD motif